MSYGYGVCGSLKYYKMANIWKISTGNCTFNPEICQADSYNWWVFVKKIKGKVVFNDYSYSPSTSGHQSAMRSLLKQLKIKIDHIVCIRQSLNDFEHSALKSLYESIFHIELQLGRKNAQKKLIKNRKNQIKELKKTIKEYRALGAVFTKLQMKELKKEVIKNDLDNKGYEKKKREKTNRVARNSTKLMKTGVEFDL